MGGFLLFSSLGDEGPYNRGGLSTRLYVMIRLLLKLGFIELFETNKQIEFVGNGVLDGPQITYTRQQTSAGR